MTIVEHGEITAARLGLRRWLGGESARAVACFAALLVVCSSAAAPRPTITTHTYKRVGSLEIRADVHSLGEAAAPRPVVVWIHGGGLINGGRERDPSTLIDGLLAAGCCVVSIDYRLAPESKLAAIVGDVEDAFRWVREEGPALFAADPKRIGVVGTSAGGYLTLVAGYRVMPRPQALVSLWGYGNLIGDWYSKPSHHERHREPQLTATEAWKGVSGPPLANSDDRPERRGRDFYQHCRQHGGWPLAVSGWDPRSEAEKYTPYLPVKNVTPAFPPTLLVHGTEDSDVPHAESAAMAREMKRHGVEHQFLSFPRGEHGLKNLAPSVMEEVNRDAVAFLCAKLGITLPRTRQ